MARYLPTLLIVVLIAATVGAFARTEALKLEPNPIAGPHVDKEFSPVCRCSKDRAHISFRLRHADRLSLSVVDGGGHVVAHVVEGRRLPAGRAQFLWNGRLTDGEVAAEGSYRPKVELDRNHRTIVLPNPIHVDTSPPRTTIVSAGPRAISPDGDGRGDVFRVTYKLSEAANAILLVDGKQRARTRFRPMGGTVSWYGRLGGHPLRPGVHRLQLVAEDAAGNRSKPTTAIRVRILYVDLWRTKIFVLPGARFGVRYDSDARSVQWRLGARGGSAKGGRIVLRAPQMRGRFTLVVTERGHQDAAAVYVGRRAAAAKSKARTKPVKGHAR